MKSFLILGALLLSILSALAQTVADGKKMLYYEKFRSAIKILEPIVKADNKNAEAAYWLGQVYLQMPKEDIGKAKAIYETSLAANSGNPLLTAATGHIYIKENRFAEAKIKFKAAEDGAAKNADILLAIARAAIDSREKNADYDYAITILNKALQLKNVNKDEAYILLGNTYRKRFDGGNADANYRNAIQADPKNALAWLRLGKIYESQRNYEMMLEFYDKAIAADPAFAPVYLSLYNHFSLRDITRGKEYLYKYIANADEDCNTELFAADYLFRSGKYTEALNQSAKLAAGNCKDEIGLRLKILNAYCYDRLKDSVSAKKNVEEFMQLEQPDKIQVTDYEMAAKTLAKFAGEETRAIEYFNKAFEKDSAGRTMYILQLIDLYKKTNNLQQVAATWDRLFTVKPKPSNLDLYNRAMAHMAIKNYSFADSLWQQYKEKYPDQLYGYTYRIKCNEALDTAMLLGLSVPHWESMVVFAGRDTVKYKTQLVGSLYKLVVYYVNIKKDTPKAIEYLTQYLLYDPNNTEAKKILDKLKAVGGN